MGSKTQNPPHHHIEIMAQQSAEQSHTFLGRNHHTAGPQTLQNSITITKNALQCLPLLRLLKKCKLPHQSCSTELQQNQYSHPPFLLSSTLQLHTPNASRASSDMQKKTKRLSVSSPTLLTCTHPGHFFLEFLFTTKTQNKSPEIPIPVQTLGSFIPQATILNRHPSNNTCSNCTETLIKAESKYYTLCTYTMHCALYRLVYEF